MLSFPITFDDYLELKQRYLYLKSKPLEYQLNYETELIALEVALEDYEDHLRNNPHQSLPPAQPQHLIL